MAFIAAHYIIKNLMRVLTPEEIDLLTTIDTGKQKISLTKILLNKINGINEVYENGFLTLQKKSDSLKKKTKEEKDNTLTNDKIKKKPSDSLTNEIDKTKENYQKIKQKEMLNHYKKNSLIDIVKEGNQKDLKESANEGILINKKQS